eukprot:1873629-Amphidinium_carterae.1
MQQLRMPSPFHHYMNRFLRNCTGSRYAPFMDVIWGSLPLATSRMFWYAFTKPAAFTKTICSSISKWNSLASAMQSMPKKP